MPTDVYTAKQLKGSLIDFYILSQGVPKEFLDKPAFQRFRLQCINAWKRTLIRDIEFCCACELRHMADNIALPKTHGWPKFFQQQFGDIGALWYDKWRTLKSSPPVPKSKDCDFNADVQYVIQQNANNSSGRKKSYLAAKGAELQLGLSLIEVAEAVFNPKHVKWSGAYGGKAWQNIAQNIYHLWHAIDLSEIVHLIDTAFALHHNTNIVFNKNIIWAGGTHYSWILKYLDYKWAAFSPVSLLGLASPELQRLVHDSGFVIGIDLPPKTLKFRNNIPTTIVLKEDDLERPVNVKAQHGQYFKSVVIKADHYKAEKVCGKYGKTIKLRIYLLEELLSRMVGKLVMGADMAKHYYGKPAMKPGVTVKEVPLGVGIPKAAGAKMGMMHALDANTDAYGNLQHPGASEDEMIALFLHFKPHLVAIYEKLSVHASTKGYALGTFLEDENVCRFRLKGHHIPLRFYFKVTSEKITVLIGHSSGEDVSKAASIASHTKETFSSHKVLQLLAHRIDKHIGS